MSGYIHWLCLDSSTPKTGCGTTEARVLVSGSIATVTCLECQAELSRRLRMALSVGDPRWLEVDWSNTNSVRTWAEDLWTTNWRLHAENQELRVKRHEEEQYAKPDPECVGCKRWTHRIKVLEERVEHARKVLEGL